MRRVGCLIAMALLTACSAATPGGTPPPQATRFTTTEPLPSPGAAQTPAASVSAARLAAIAADLKRRGVDAENPRVMSAEQVTFNDGSLGCPVPGVQYTQGQVQGMRVVVEAMGASYDYRFGAGDVPTLCDQRRPGSAPTTR